MEAAAPVAVFFMRGAKGKGESRMERVIRMGQVLSH